MVQEQSGARERLIHFFERGVGIVFSEFWDWDWDRFFRILGLGLGSIFQNFGIGIGIDFSKFWDWDWAWDYKFRTKSQEIQRNPKGRYRNFK